LTAPAAIPEKYSVGGAFMEEKKKQKKRERRYWEREFLTHEFNSAGVWVPKTSEPLKNDRKRARRRKEVFSPPGVLTRAQERRSCLSYLRSKNRLRALRRWKRRWHYVEPIDLTNAFTE